MRILTILCSGIVALSLLAAPAGADPTDNSVFVIFDLGGFSGDGTNDYNCEQPSNLLIVNLASVNGSIENFLGLTFNNIDFGDEFDLTDVSYFILGHITGSDHLILSDAEGDPGAIDSTFEEPIIDGIRNMDQLDPTLADPGGFTTITRDDFMNQFGTGVDTFSSPDPNEIPFDPVADVGGEVDLLGFTDPVFLTTIRIDFVDGNIVGTQVPEPALAILAVMGLAGAAIARRRRSLAA